MDDAWINTLIGGGLAIAGGIASTFYQAKVTRQTEARQLAKAIKGELSAIVEIATARNYAQGILSAIEFVESTGKPYIVAVSVRREYTIVYAQNAARIGLLEGDLPTKVAVVYTKLSSILEDFALLYEVNKDPSRKEEFTVDHCLEFYKELHSLIVGTLDQARDVVREIGITYPPNA